MSLSISQNTKIHPSGIKDSIGQFIVVVKESASKFYVVLKKVMAFALTVILAVALPGYFILGAGVGLTIGVLSSTKFLNESFSTISKIWERQTFLSSAAIVFMSFWGLPYTPYIASFLRGMHIGAIQALEPVQNP